MNNSKKKNGTLIVFFAILFASIATILIILLSQNQSKGNVDTEINMMNYNTSYKIGAYTISLKKGIYSEKTRNGYLVFEVEKEKGKVEVQYEHEKQKTIQYFGDSKNQMTIDLMATGSITNKAAYKGNKLEIKTNFQVDDIEEDKKEEFDAHPIYVYCANDEEKSMNGEYGFKLNDNCKYREIKFDNKVLYISALGVFLQSNSKMDNCIVEVETSSGERKKILELGKNADIPGCYSSAHSSNTYCYNYSYDELYSIGKNQKIYIDGKEVS